MTLGSPSLPSNHVSGGIVSGGHRLCALQRAHVVWNHRVKLAHADPGLLGSGPAGLVACGGDAGFTRLHAAGQDGLSEALEGGAFLRKPTLPNSAPQSTSFTCPLKQWPLQVAFASASVPPLQGMLEPRGFSSSSIAAKNNAAAHTSFPVFCNYKHPKRGDQQKYKGTKKHLDREKHVKNKTIKDRYRTQEDDHLGGRKTGMGGGGATQ